MLDPLKAGTAMTDEVNPNRKSTVLDSIGRREVLRAAGFTVAASALGLAYGDDGSHARDQSDHSTANSATGAATSRLYPHLFSELKIGTFTVRNRIVSTAHHTVLARDGAPSKRQQDYWVSKARGGIGLIMTEVQPIFSSATQGAMIACLNPAVIPAFKPIVSAIHDHGARIVAQLWHGGKAYGGAFAPSGPVDGGTRPRALTREEIATIVTQYAQSAANMREAGLDGVEVHMAHNYLPLEFLTPLDNRRVDEYGGSDENRLRFPIEILRAVRAKVGPDFTVGIRFCGDEARFRRSGLTHQQLKVIAQRLVKEGALDFVNVTVVGADIIMPMGEEHGKWVYLAEGIKESVDVPVCCIGRINHPGMADAIVAGGRADLVGMTRANICDPELPNKSREGRVAEIRPCAGLMYCWGSVFEGRGVGHVTCALNPSAGREAQLAYSPAAKKRKVMVVGGGLAGLEAARVAADRGHNVTLYERGERLGGQVIPASKAPLRSEMAQILPYYETHFRKLGVTIKRRTTVTAALFKEESPEVIILSTGGLPKKLELPNVATGTVPKNIVQGRDVLLGLAEVGNKIVVAGSDEGAHEAITVTDFLGRMGKQVILLLPFHASARDPGQRLPNVEQIEGVKMLERLAGHNVRVQRDDAIIAIDGESVTTHSGVISGVATVVLALGSVANNPLEQAARDTGAEVHVIGQAAKAEAKVADSVLQGLQVGRVI